MNIGLYLAARNITRDIKRSLLLLSSVTIIFTLMIAVSVIKTNAFNYQVVDAEINYGRWHLAYIATDVAGVGELEKDARIENATLGYRLEPLSVAGSNLTLDLTLFQEDKFRAFTTPLIRGRLPETDKEIIVPDWYLRHGDIESLPAKLETGEFDFIVTGVYRGRSFGVLRNSLAAYGLIEANDALLRPGLLSIDPSARRFVSQTVANSQQRQETRFAYIRLAADVPVNDIVVELTDGPGLREFSTKDWFLADLNRESSPEYNSDLLIAEQRKGLENEQVRSSIAQLRRVPLIITGALAVALFTMVFVSMNLVANKRMRSLGLLAAVGLEPKKNRDVVILEAVLTGLVALPVGIVGGIAASRLVLQNTVGALYGTLVIPGIEMCISAITVVLAIALAACYPALKAARLAPLVAINQQAGAADKVTVLPLGLVKGRYSFPVIYALKNSFKHPLRFIGVVAVIALLLAAFIPLSMQIERLWLVGSPRQSYQAHHRFYLPYMGGGELRDIDPDFLEQLSAIDSIKRLYFQHGVTNDLRPRDDYGKNLYQYEWRLAAEEITDQGLRVFELAAPTKRAGQPPDRHFIFGGVSGYGEAELALSEEFLIEGSIDLEKMATEPVVLLPKFITMIGNTDIPYTKLAIGDTITLIESVWVDGTIDIIAEYTFEIGGFLSALPFRQVNGASSGFVGIMHKEQLDQLGTDFKGIMEVYIDDKDGENSFSELEALSAEYEYGLTSDKDSFMYTEQMSELQLVQMGLYSIFGTLAVVLFLALSNLLISGLLVRKQEFAMLSALGMEHGQIRIAVISETFSYGVLGTLLGVMAGLSIIHFTYSSSEVLAKAQLIPWRHILASAGLMLMACVAAAVIGMGIVLRNITIQDVKND